MNSSEHVETAIGLLTSTVIAGAWWFVAIRLQRPWFFYGLAIVATIGTLISAGIVFVAASQQPLTYLSVFSHIQSVFAVADALLYILLAFWLVRASRTHHVA